MTAAWVRLEALPPRWGRKPNRRPVEPCTAQHSRAWLHASKHAQAGSEAPAWRSVADAEEGLRLAGQFALARRTAAKGTGANG